MLKLLYFGYLLQRADSLEKTLMLGKIEHRRRRGRQRTRWLDIITNSIDMSLSKLQEIGGQGSLVCCSPWGSKESDTTGRLNNKRNTLLFSNNNFTKGKCACVVGGAGIKSEAWDEHYYI